MADQIDEVIGHVARLTMYTTKYAEYSSTVVGDDEVFRCAEFWWEERPWRVAMVEFVGGTLYFRGQISADGCFDLPDVIPGSPRDAAQRVIEFLLDQQ